MELGKLGTVTDERGNSAYRAWKNPLLRQGILGLNPGGYDATPMNPAALATGLAASAIAEALGGKVVADPQAEQWNLTAPVLAIQIDDREPVNAGYLCTILGNDVAYGVRAKSWEISQLLGMDFDPTIADRLFRAVLAGGV